MALPIRLLVGPKGGIEIPLEAQSIDIAVDRKASTIPTPNMERFAIDTNTPSIEIEIAGILQDDEPSFESESTTSSNLGGSVMINFASNFPTTVSKFGDEVIRNTQGIIGFYDNIKLRSSVNAQFGTTSSSTVVDIIDFDTPNVGNLEQAVTFSAPLVGTGSYIGAQVNNGSGISVGATAIAYDGLSSHSISNGNLLNSNGDTLIRIGDRIHKSSGALIGTVTNLTTNVITVDSARVTLADDENILCFRAALFTRQGQLVGHITDITLNSDSSKVTTITLDTIDVPINDSERYFIDAFGMSIFEATLHDKELHFFPNFCRAYTSGYLSNITRTPLNVILRFNANEVAHNTYTTASTDGEEPRIIQSGIFNLGMAVNKQDIIVELPIKDLSTKAAGGNPAAQLALMVQDALEISDNAMVNSNDYITSTNGNSILSAFDTTVSGPLISVTQKDKALDGYTQTKRPCNPFNSNLSSNKARFEYFGADAENLSISNKSKSAGDKVQDLLGLVSNAKKNKDLIRGIQIPYDSLIQSSGVTGVARNFFLTFGAQSIDDKGSLANTISASKKMVPSLLPYDLGGDPVDETDEDWSEKFFLGELASAVGTLTNFVGNLIGDTLVTLQTVGHGNDGGIRIIPEKLHVRYDAGNNYYAFNLKLMASDFVIGV
tara:strand:- start:5857 stop:7842 length:1986 start_codon:yes stop_codon:yes gene_type:complete